MASMIISGIVMNPTESDVISRSTVTATPRPPTPTASPSIRPETEPGVSGAISWAMATVTAKVDQRMNPKMISATSDMDAFSDVRKTKNGGMA